jgi:hypothetical protein
MADLRDRRHSKRDYPVAANVKTGRFPTTSVLACKETYMQTLAIVTTLAAPSFPAFFD